MAREKRQINLLPQDEFEQSFLGRLLKWALSVGRYIVIGTELVVIGSFLTRFSLDRQVTDLNEAIAQKQAVVASYGELEPEIRSIQKRLAAVSGLSEQQLGVNTQLEKITALTPVDVAYSLIGLTPEAINLSGVAFSEAGFRTLLSEVRANDEFTRVDITRVSSEGNAGTGIEFEIEISLVAQGLNQTPAPPPEDREAGGVDGL